MDTMRSPSDIDFSAAYCEITICINSITFRINLHNTKINQSYEGIEARIITILGGAIELVSSNDGFNATDKRSTTETNTKETEQEI